MENRTVMSGGQAIVRGAIESGVRIISGYPGYPITGIVEGAKKTGVEDLYIEWAPNEKVALETVLGTSIAGFRGMAVMKQVGLNVAADPLMAAVSWGVQGGVVIVAGDDPGCEASPVEQDSRCYGSLANIPVLEPSTPEEGRQMVRAAFSVSEKFGLPIILRFTKEYIAMKGEVRRGDISQAREMLSKNMLLPFRGSLADSVKGHYLRHKKIELILADLSQFNTQEGNGGLGIVTGGYAVNFVDSALNQLGVKEKVSVLKLGVIPATEGMIEAFLRRVNQVLVIEVGEPLIEQQVRGLSTKPVFGKMSGHMSYVGQIKVDDLVRLLETFIGALQSEKWDPGTATFGKILDFDTEEKAPAMAACPGCPGIGLQYSLKKAKEKCDFLVFCDHGCVGLSALPPYETLDHVVSMGGSTGAAHGAWVGGKKAVALIGDSAFMHSGIGGLLNMVNNDSKTAIIVFDNLSTAMSGRQPNPATGMTIRGQKTKRIGIEDLCKACGVEEVAVVDPYDLKECQKAIEKAVTSEKMSVLIVRRECALLPGINYGQAKVDAQKCNLCMDCVEKISCPALSFKERIEIDEKCIGCMICGQVCPEDAIYKIETFPSGGRE
jgi:indolepyruvate ferredoxin oxidoreductase alpha subunit